MHTRPAHSVRWPTAVIFAVLLALPLGFLVASPAVATGITVVTVTSAADPGTGGCTASECTLREAIAKANASFGAQTIRFAVGSGALTISPSTGLPALTDRVTLDGTSQPGYAGTPLVTLDGSGSSGSTGLWAKSGRTEVRGLAISEFSQQQLLLTGSSGVIRDNELSGGGTAVVRINASSQQNQVTGNSIGGGQVGVLVDAGSSRNLISGNSIAGNAGLGIDLGGNGVDVTGPPVLTDVARGPDGVTVFGSFEAAIGKQRIDVYANAACDPSGYGEGEFPVGSFEVVVGEPGGVSFSHTFGAESNVPPTDLHTFTATITRNLDANGQGETSEFSGCQTDYDPPPSPVGVAAGAGDGDAEVSWIAPDTGGGLPLDHYTVHSLPDTASTPVEVPAGTLTVVVPGLTNGTDYTFTVTATNTAGKTSAPSAPSESITPLSDAAAPEAASAVVSAGQTLTTGSDATTADPTNTSVDTPNGGIVSIGEGAMTGTPPAGVTYLGQQIDVTAPDASTANPMRFTFVVDCSELPADISSCSGAGSPLAALQDFGGTGGTTVNVDVTDTAFVPAAVSVAPGTSVRWQFVGTKAHSVVDSSRLGKSAAPLFSSGTRSPGSSYTYRFASAGHYPYASTVWGDQMKGSIDVPVTLSATTADTDTPVTVTWSSASAPIGYRFDVQYRHQAPGQIGYGLWKGWRTNTTAASSNFTGADAKGAGSYQFRARLENVSTGKVSGWSAPTELTVQPAGPSRLATIAIFHETVGGNVQVPDCTGPEGVAQPSPSCTWSETILANGDLQVVVFTTENGRWRPSRVATF